MKFIQHNFINLFCAAIFLLTIAATLSFAQEPDVLKIDATLVRLNVGVVDKQGRSITNLSRNDFTIYEDDVKQDISRFAPTTAPFSLVILLDTSGSTRSFRQQMAQAAMRFTDALSPEDRVAVIAFNSKPEVLTDFTTNQKNIKYAISLVQSNGRSGETKLYQALEFAMQRLQRESNRRKGIVVLTDGIDTELENDDRRAANDATNTETALASIKPETNAKLIKVLDAADKQGVTVYPLALPSGDPKRLPDPLPFTVARYTAARERLQIIADRTGGSLNAINRLEDMGRLYASVAAELRTLYSVEYQPSNDRRSGVWRKIRIEVNRPELLAKTRPGYFAK
jgi:VWFA-related protein